MPVNVVMPKLGLTMTEGVIVEWLKQEGEEVKKGETLFVLETEKVTYEVDAPQDGILAEILILEQITVPVGEPVAVLLKPGETLSDPDRVDRVSTAEQPCLIITADQSPASQDAGIVDQTDRKIGFRIKATPYAKKIAGSSGIDLQAVKGTGPGNMICGRDVEAVVKERSAKAVSSSTLVTEPPACELVSLTGMRRTIAQKMLASKVETAQTYMSNTLDAGNLVTYRKQHLPGIEKRFGVRLTITDLLMKLVTNAILKHPVINTRWTEQGIAYLKTINMGMALALEDGLMVPVIHDIKEKRLGDIATIRQELVQKGKRGSLLPDDIKGSTFTLSSLGMYSVEQFTANINVPENAILAVGSIMDKPAVVDGHVDVRPMMTITLSYDHRTIDGVEAAKFMRTLTSLIENPAASLTNPKRDAPRVNRNITVIGGGVAGYTAAIKAAGMGAEVTLVEKDLIGGVCLNRGCIPTKSLLQSCKVLKTVQQSERYGIESKGHSYRLEAIMQRKNAVVEQLRGGVEKLLQAKKIRIVKGTANLISPTDIRIRETAEQIPADKIIIASGSRPKGINLEGTDGSGIWNSNDLLAMESLPASVAIIGGGAIGIEFAQILNRLGVDVSIFERMEHLAPGLDREIALALEEALTKEGIKVFTDIKVQRIKHSNPLKTLEFVRQAESGTCVVEKIIISVGREPDLDWLDTSKIGLTKQKGALLVNERMETNLPGVYAAGDVTGGIMLAHVAIAEGECAARNAAGGEARMDYDAIPSCIYTFPEVAAVGLSEEKAGERYDIQVGRFSFHGSGKALILAETYGMVKIVSDRNTGLILGVHIIGPQATDLIGEAVLGISKQITVTELAAAIHPHPSLAETIMESAMTLCGGAIHMP